MTFKIIAGPLSTYQKRKGEKGKKGKGEKKKRRKGEKKKRRKKRKRKKEKEKKREKRPTLEMASEGPQRITEKYYGVYLPSYTIYPFVIPLVIYPRRLFISDDLVLVIVYKQK